MNTETYLNLRKRLDTEIAESRAKGVEPVLSISKAEEDLLGREAKYPLDEEPTDTLIYKGVPVRIIEDETTDEQKQDYGEPWVIIWDERGYGEMRDAKGGFISGVGETCAPGYIFPSDAKRIVACVSACTGIPMDKLKDAVMKCSICGSPDVVYGYLADGRAQKVPVDGVVNKLFCRGCLPPELPNSDIPGGAIPRIAPIVIPEDDTNRESAKLINDAIATLRSKVPFTIPCPRCGTIARLQIVGSLSLKWHEARDHSVEVAYHCTNCGYEGIPEGIAKKEDDLNV